MGGGGGGKAPAAQPAPVAPAATTEVTPAPAVEEGMTDEQKAARQKQLAAAADAKGRSGTLFGGSEDLGVAPTTKTVLGG